MNKKFTGFVFALALLLGSSMAVCAEEAQKQDFQQMMTPEILASFDSISIDMEDEEAMAVMKNAILLRTDVWGELQDADGDGIDDRDLVNGCGYIDLNCNGFDDRFELALIYKMAEYDQEGAQAVQIMFNLLSHQCRHGVVYSDFSFDEDLGYWSMPDYFDKCEQCREEFDTIEDAIDKAFSQYLR
ncbi:hypothetical protein V1224_14220 [Lachnospiraceae bacterium JLR.KK008]